MATGKHLYAETSGPQLIAQILERPPSPPTSRNRKISPVLEAIILKAMDRDPDRRYQSAREMRIDLERLSSGSTRIAIRGRRVWPWIVAAAVALLAILLVWNPGNIRGRVADWRVRSSSLRGRRSVAVLGFLKIVGKPQGGGGCA